jgi:hypothetical protein
MKKKEFSLLFNQRKNITKKPLIEESVTPYPVRFNALGKSKNAKQGVAGWRQQYHRPFQKLDLTPAVVTTITYPDDE